MIPSRKVDNSLRARLSNGLKRLIPGRAKMTGISTLSPVSMPSTRSIQRIKDFFDSEYNRYQLYRMCELLDSDYQSSLSTAAMVVVKSMVGFQVKPGEELDKEEKALEKALEDFERIIKPYYYDIAYKIFRDGDACYVIDRIKDVGIRELVWLPIERLTVMDSKSDWRNSLRVAQEGNWYCLNEFPSGEGTELQREPQWFPKDKVAHFNWNRREKVRDINARTTFNIYTLPPTESLSLKLTWKLSLLANDMMLREVLVPREHHKLPSESFNPDFFQGENQEARIAAAQQAAQTVLKTYAKGLEGRRVDRGYVTLDNVTIEIVEPDVKYTSPNELLQQIDDGINRSLGTPESVLSGRAAARASFASEVAVGAYLVMKAEFVAEAMVDKLIELAKNHLDVKYAGRFKNKYGMIDFKLQLIFFQSEMARTLAILASLGCFTRTELRDMYGLDPLREDQEEDIVDIGRGFAQSRGQVASTSSERQDQVQAQRTERSIRDTQIT